MKDWKKAVLWTLVGFCMISVVIGVFNLFVFLQTESTEIITMEINKATHNFYQSVTVAALICVMSSIALIAVMIIFFTKNKVSDKRKIIFVSQIVVLVILVISLFFIVFSFCTQYIFKADKFYAFYYGKEFYSKAFYHYQSYLSAMLSTFLPLLIADGIIFGYLIYSYKTQNREEISDKEKI